MEGLDDSDEILSYRAAALVLLLASVYVTVWLVASGVPIGVALFFLEIVVEFCPKIRRIWAALRACQQISVEASNRGYPVSKGV